MDTTDTANPMQYPYLSANLPIKSQSCIDKHHANPMPIHANLGSIHTDNAGIPDGTSTIRIVSARDDRDSPRPTRCQSNLNCVPICQSITNLSIHHQSKNPMQILDKFIIDLPIHHQSNIPMLILDQSTRALPISQYNANPQQICQSISNPPMLAFKLQPWHLCLSIHVSY